MIDGPTAQFLRSAKQLVLKGANRLGVSAMVGESQWRRHQLLVLCYHGISQHDEHEWSDLYVSPDHLESRLALLRKSKANILPLEEALSGLFSDSLPPCAISLTFDDGYSDFATKAVPLLEAESVHTTLYLSTYYCRKQLPVFDPVVSYILWKGRGRTVALPGLRHTLTIPAFTRDSEFRELHARLLAHAAAAGLDADEKHEFARVLANRLGVDFEEICERRILHLLSPDQVRALDPKLVSVQLHTHRHRTPSTLAHAQEELVRNAHEIAELTGRKERLKHFCYPSGQYSPAFVDWLTTHGVASATTCEPGYTNRNTPRLAIPRFVDTGSVSADTFLAWASGSAAFAQFRRSRDGYSDTPPDVPAVVLGKPAVTAPPAAAPVATSKQRTSA